jgi:hypothetical protein
MRLLVATLTLASLSLACGDNGDMNITLTATMPTTGGPSGDPGATQDPGTTQAPTTVTPTTGGLTTDELTTDPITGGPTTGSTTVDPTTGGDSSSSSGGDDTSLMKTYGAPCATDADCVKLLGADGKCLKDILGVYALPDGYCSTICQLPDQQTTYITDAPDCLMMADCVGLMGYFEGCAHACTDDSQCPREGYECRRMPQISNEGDPEFCLMTEDNMIPP